MNEKTLLHRQIHPTWVQNNTVSSQAFLIEKSIASLAFTPSEKDKDKLSVYNGEKFTPEEAFIHYTKNLESAGVLSISYSEVNSVEDLTIHEDNNPFNGHTVIDYSQVTSPTQIKKKAKKLKNLAVARDWTYRQ